MPRVSLPRLHLFELEDQSWFPSSWRNFMTDYLRYVEGKFQLHRLALEPLTRALDDSGAERIVDLCSGAGGPLVAILGEWAAEGSSVSAVLTDLYPHAAIAETAGGLVEYRREPVDAAAVPPELIGLRTLFNGLHHFRPKQAKAVLADAVRASQPLAVFEVADRTLLAIVPLVFVPLFVLLMTPFIRPFRWTRLFWTYLIPVLPLAILFDGVVSYLRAYTPNELLAMAQEVEPAAYRWQAGYLRAPKLPGRMTYLTGMPAVKGD
ncbi:MAG: hypothetical protein O3A53_11560 [Acidobacteria bacterium]|nr:hypothetical protein [Acidobacteriota bacterium]MDA1235427.1 hypothetical protein [Acidobacteriota bacterium]